MTKKIWISGLDNDGMEAAMFLPTVQPLKLMWSIEVLRITRALYTECVMKATPNVTTLLIGEIEYHWPTTPFPIDFRTIANSLPKLQFLGWLICMPMDHDLLHLVNAAITGFPLEFCKENSEKFRNRDSLSPDELAIYQLQRRNASILDLKGITRRDAQIFKLSFNFSSFKFCFSMSY